MEAKIKTIRKFNTILLAINNIKKDDYIKMERVIETFNARGYDVDVKGFEIF